MSTLKHLICNVIKIDVLRIKKLKVYCIDLLKIMPTLCIFFFSQLDLRFMNSFIKTWTSEKAKMIYQIP